ncbi:MAG: TonB-dependent receptor [Lutibacter sp.]|uniref:TonB-dependent receptor domain-containing protein n=1 Tax=Lutibacter sp. TaxID=1925666 RepID=UPI0018239154|nr:TonB-dependent receptor [Lutibacter sp.]MBT8316205.1 TonB-dependent receptor [Lutibacter sp.]NNJ57065.1 TonB-dependent receptor [Lutibacter sp.]
MKNKLINLNPLKLTAIVLLISQSIISQTITGNVIDEDKLPLEFVSVALLQPKDSMLVSYTSTGEDGKFELSEIKNGTYLFQVYLMTYQANQQVLTIEDSPVNLGTLTLKKEVNQLNEVTINAVVPIKIKQDTVAFNSKAFRVRQDDNVEDLIKKLPGIQIATDGTVSAQGQDVTRILVDGKEFFNNDQTIALKNLSADAIKSVQIIDEESDDTRTTGIKDGEKNKIINLVLKEGKKSGYFGKMGAGIGTNERYTSNFDINRFTSNTQLAVFGNLNNINNTGASVFRRDGSRGSSNSGFLTTGTAGANYNYEFKKDLNFNIDYNYGYSDNEQEESSNRTQFTNDKLFTSEREETSQNISNNHNVNFSLRDRSKKDTYLEFRGNFKKDNRESDSSNSTVFFDENNLEDTNSNRITTTEDDRNNGGLNFSYRKKINEVGRNIRVRAGVSFVDNDDTNYQEALNKFNVSDAENFQESNETTIRNEQNKSLNYNVSARYMEPIVPHHFVSFSSEIENSKDEEYLNQSRTINTIEQNPFIFNTDYNNQVFDNQLGYVFSKDEFQFYLSGGLQTMNQKLDVDNAKIIDKTYDNFLPRATVSYEYKKGKRVRFRYNKSTELPSANRVSPVVNDFNPLSISTGNINLTPEIADNFNIMYYSNDFKTANSFFTFFNYSKTTNAIVTDRTIDDNFIQYSTFENFGSKSNFRGFISVRRKIKKIGFRYNFRIDGNASDYITIINGEYNKTKSKGANFDLNLSNENKNNIDLTVGAKYGFNKTTYSLQDRDRDFFEQNYYAKIDFDITNSVNFNTQFDYNLFTDNNFDSQNVPIWNMAVEYAFMKGKRGNLKFMVFDILDRNIGIERTSTENYFEETFRQNLGTYAMLSFTYNIKPPTGTESKRGSSDRRRGYRVRH